MSWSEEMKCTIKLAANKRRPLCTAGKLTNDGTWPDVSNKESLNCSSSVALFPVIYIIYNVVARQ